MVVLWTKSLKEFIGVVVSDVMDKTSVVSVPLVKLHPLYKKRYTIYKKYYVHDVDNQSKKGDKVKIRQCTPVSKTKRWSLIEVVKK